jgi:hypothetical protein
LQFATQVSRLCGHALQAPGLPPDMKVMLTGMSDKATALIAKLAELDHHKAVGKSLQSEIATMAKELRAAAVTYGHRAIAEAAGDVIKALAFGLSEASKKTTGKPLMTPPTGLTVTKTTTTGKLTLECDAYKHAHSYTFERRFNTPADSPWELACQGTRRRQDVKGMPPEQEIWFRVTASGPSGTSPPSEGVMITV